MEEDTSVYHEKQQLQLCALHVLNNLLQEQKAFTKADLDQICNKKTIRVSNSLDPDQALQFVRTNLGPISTLFAKVISRQHYLSPESWINPHKSVFGLGNYDVNVIMAALQSRDLSTVWFDKRKDVKCLDLKKIKGLIVNMPYKLSIGFLKLPVTRKHWFVIREIDDAYFNLDSKLSEPERIGSVAETLEYLRVIMEKGDRELLLVVDSDVEQSGSWKRTT